MEKKPKILITNDDGIHSKGIWHLWKALSDFADLSIVAPAAEKSGVGLSLTLYKPIMINPVPWEKNTPAYKLTGTPADCVRFATRVVLKETPDLIVSGINHGSNAGRNVLYSGTIGGVTEGALRGIPGIAFSSTSMITPDFERIEPHILPIVKHILEHPLSKGTILNVNFPTDTQDLFKGVKLARQGKSLMREAPDERQHPGGNSYYWHGGEWSHHEEHDESDIALLARGYITAAPIHVDELTDHNFFKERKTHFDSMFESS